jgi:hypothetical protein
MHFITGIRVTKDGDTEFFNESRCFGFYSSLSAATCAVETNECDIFENYYKYVVIEEIDKGIHPEVVSEYWFEWDEVEQKYMGTYRPLCVNNCCNFSLG